MHSFTFAVLRQNGACIMGYNTLLCGLRNMQLDRIACDRYLLTTPGEEKYPITLKTVLDCNGLVDAVWCLSKLFTGDDMRMYIIAILKHMFQHEMPAKYAEFCTHVCDSARLVEVFRKEFDAECGTVITPRQLDILYIPHFVIAAYDWRSFSRLYERARIDETFFMADLFKCMCDGTAPWQTTTTQP